MNGNDDALYAKHLARKDVEWIPYHARISEGRLVVSDEGRFAKVEMEVAGLGTLTILGERIYNFEKQRYEWHPESPLSARV